MNHTPQNTTPIAFVNVNVVPMDSDRILPGQTVIVRGDRISEMGSVDAIDVPEGAQRIDGRGRYLMPGLVDMHVHSFRRPLARPMSHDQLILFITNGVTAVRNMWGGEEHLKLREEIRGGKLTGPTIYTTGPIIDGNPPYSPDSAVAETPEQAAQMVAEQKKIGYDFIKVYNRLSVDVYDALVESAAKCGMPVVGHVARDVGIEHALSAGQHSVEHLSGYGRFLQAEDSSSWQHIDEAKVPYIVQATRKAGTWNCVTLVMNQKTYMSREEMKQELKLPYMKYIPLPRRQMLEIIARERDRQYVRDVMCNRKKMTKALHDAGARVLLGTDTLVPYVEAGFSVHQELRCLVDAGLTPYEAIRAGTRDAAECLGILDEFGTVSVGLRADLLLVEDNPLVDVGNAAKLNGVMLRGRWFSQSELQSMLDALEGKQAAEENPDGVMLRGRWYPRSELEVIVDAQNERKMEQLVEGVLSSDRIFLTGTGDSEPVARSSAMKLMQAGFHACVVGDETTLAIEEGDILIAVSRSGRGRRTLEIASAAKRSGASVFLLTGRSTTVSWIGDISDLVVVLGPYSPRDDFNRAVQMFIDEAIALIAERQK